MRVTLTFDLPDEEVELLNALAAPAYVSMLNAVDRELRAHIKYGADLDPESLRREMAEELAETPWQR